MRIWSFIAIIAALIGCELPLLCERIALNRLGSGAVGKESPVGTGLFLVLHGIAYLVVGLAAALCAWLARPGRPGMGRSVAGGICTAYAAMYGLSVWFCYGFTIEYLDGVYSHGESTSAIALVFIPFWIMLLGVGAFVTGVLMVGAWDRAWSWVTRSNRDPELAPHCASCGYSLKSFAGRRCPECGSEL